MVGVHDFEADDEAAGAFADVFFAARAGDARTILSPRASTLKQLSSTHPLWQHVQRRFFFVSSRARCAALINPRLVDGSKTPYGQIGFFEAVDDDAGRAVLDAALAWLKQRGVKTALGPMNGSTWHSYRFVIDWHELSPLLLEPNNPVRYPQLWLAHGWQKHETPYYSSVVDNAACVRALQQKHKDVLASGYRTVPIDLRDLPGVLRKLYALSTEIFQDNAFYSDITFEEFAPLYDGVERILDPTLVHWILKGDDVAGFAFGVPDLAERVRAMRGETGLLAKLRFVTAPKPTRGLMKTVAVKQEHRGKGLLSEIYFQQSQAGLARGWPTSIVTLMAGDNRSFTGGQKIHKVVREYGLFTREVA